MRFIAECEETIGPEWPPDGPNPPIEAELCCSCNGGVGEGLDETDNGGVAEGGANDWLLGVGGLLDGLFLGVEGFSEAMREGP